MHAAAALTGWAWLVWLSGQLEHPEWNGFTLYDLIFPLFLFMAGVAMPFSFEKRLERGDTQRAALSARHRARTAAGAVGNDLQRPAQIRLAQHAASQRAGPHRPGLPVCRHHRAEYERARAGAVDRRPAGGLLGRAEVHSRARLRRRRSCAGPHADRLYRSHCSFPGGFHAGDRDPEGLLATIPAIATALFGAVTGQWLKSERRGGYVKTARHDRGRRWFAWLSPGCGT